MAKRTSSQLPLLNFFTKTKKISESTSVPPTNNKPVADTPTPSTSREITTEEESTFTKPINICDDLHFYDLGKYVNISTEEISNETKVKLLKSPWTPDLLFDFPASGKRNLKFQRQWLQRFSWLAYTKTNGALCKYCVLFSKETAGKGGHQKLKSLVKEPYKNWKDALEVFKTHENHLYHKEAMISGSNFLCVTKDPNRDIRNIVDSAKHKQAHENREKLTSIVETIKFCGRQELALKGTNDSGPVTTSDQEPTTNDGNFRALLRMRMKCGDQKLIAHSENMNLNASYLSPTIQNELIEICGNIIQKQIVSDINAAGVFSILVDETADIAGNEQLSLCVRYTKQTETCFVTKEDFLGFVCLEHTTGQDIANTIMSSLKDLGLNGDDMVGQGYDGAAVMKGSFKGVQAVIKKEHPAALYVHCASHSLNLALSHSCGLQSVRNCVGTVKTVTNFLKGSPKRESILQRTIKSTLPDTQWKTLTAMCETRWVENHNSLLKFKELYKAILTALEELSDDQDMETSSKASAYVKAMLNGEFVVTLFFLSQVFSYTITLCKILQSPLCDLKSTSDRIQNIVERFKNMRENIENEFFIVFNNAKALINDVDGEIKMPRLTPSQRNRVNFQTTDPEKYFMIAVAIPLLDDFVCQLESRFLEHKDVFAGLNSLLPSVCCKSQSLDLDRFKIYQNKVDLEMLPYVCH